MLIIEKLLKQYDCTSAHELLTAVAEAEADLDLWYQMEGETAVEHVNHIQATALPERDLS